MQTANAMWSEFREAFARTLAQIDEQILWTIWQNSDARTKYYREQLMPAVCRELPGGLTYEREFLCIDYAYCEPTANVPVMLIESENNAFKADGEEIPKLCTVSTLARVLLTCCSWSSDWPGGGHGSRLKQAWRETYLLRNAVVPIVGVFGVIVCEWVRHRAMFRITAFELNDASLTETVLLQRELREQPIAIETSVLHGR